MINFLKTQAQMRDEIRVFFESRSVLEVQTPLLRKTVGMEPHIIPMEVLGKGFLQTSPELAMKQLLAQKSGCIYQLVMTAT